MRRAACGGGDPNAFTIFKMLMAKRLLPAVPTALRRTHSVAQLGGQAQRARLHALVHAVAPAAFRLPRKRTQGPSHAIATLTRTASSSITGGSARSESRRQLPTKHHHLRL